MSESRTLDRPVEYRVTPRYTEVDMLTEERRIVLQEVQALDALLSAKKAKAAHLKRRIDSLRVER